MQVPLTHMDLALPPDTRGADENTQTMQEQKNLQLGQLFVLAALARAGRVCNTDTAVSVVSTALSLAAKRPFLAEAAMSVTLDICDSLSSDSIADLVERCVLLNALLLQPVEDATPEALQAALHLWPHLPVALRTECALLPDSQPPTRALFLPDGGAGGVGDVDMGDGGGVRPHADAAAAAAFFAPQHLRKLEQAAQQSSVATPRLHSMWQHVLRLLIPGFEMRRGGGPRASMAAALGSQCAPHIDHHF
jgi:DNA polymerase phi